MNQKNIIFKKVQIDNNWSLFMDRDGVINKRIESNYVKRPEEFELLPGIIESLKHFSEIFGKIFIVTNQQGVKRGIMTEEELLKVHNYMLNLIHNNGGRIDKIYYCTDLAESNSFYRKPNTGMALRAKKDFPDIKFSKSIMIGDSLSDMQFGKRLKMITVFISDNNNMARKYYKLIDFNFKSVAEFSNYLK
jgi:histidinol-phosphate phosphatase family protein